LPSILADSIFNPGRALAFSWRTQPTIPPYGRHTISLVVRWGTGSAHLPTLFLSSASWDASYERLEVSGMIGHPNDETVSVFVVLDSDLSTLQKISSDQSPGPYKQSFNATNLWSISPDAHVLTFYAVSDLGQFAREAPSVALSAPRARLLGAVNPGLPIGGGIPPSLTESPCPSPTVTQSPSPSPTVTQSPSPSPTLRPTPSPRASHSPPPPAVAIASNSGSTALSEGRFADAEGSAVEGLGGSVLVVIIGSVLGGILVIAAIAAVILCVVWPAGPQPVQNSDPHLGPNVAAAMPTAPAD
jgi:hypothetical protein